MTLREWSDQTGIPIDHPALRSDATCVYCVVGTVAYRLLWGVTDYAVSSVSGPTVWLVPIRPTSPIQESRS